MIGVSLQRLSTQELGLVYDVHQQVLYEETKGEGLHSGPPGFEFIKFPAVFRSQAYDNLLCLNKDGVEITISVDFQYRPNREHILPLASQFRNETVYYEIIQQQGETVVYRVCGRFDTEQFQTARVSIENAIIETLQEDMSKFYTDVASVQVRNIARPSQFESAVRAKEAARENIELAQNERGRRIIEVTTKLRETEAEAEITLDRANSDASVLLTQANATAKGILEEFRTEVGSYLTVMKANNLTIEGLLSYLGTRLIEESTDEVHVNMAHPAKPSYADEL